MLRKERDTVSEHEKEAAQVLCFEAGIVLTLGGLLF
jgi:hypothetical protein